MLRWEGVEEVVPSELWEGVGLLVNLGGGHPLRVSGDICGLSGASEEELQASSFARAAATRRAFLLRLCSSISMRSDSVARVEANVVARPLRLRVGGSSSGPLASLAFVRGFGFGDAGVLGSGSSMVEFSVAVVCCLRGGTGIDLAILGLTSEVDVVDEVVVVVVGEAVVDV